MAQSRKRKTGDRTGANGHQQAQPTQQAVETSSPAPADGNGTQAPHHLHASIAALAYDLYERRGRADGFDVDDWLKAEELIASQAGMQGA